METIRHMLIGKRNIIWSISPDESVYEALRLMADKSIGALLVVKKNRLVGIISERDYARKVILMGRSSRDTHVSEIMSEPVITIHPDQTIMEAMELMTNHHIRHLPVSEDGKTAMGVISIGDVLHSLIYRQQKIIQSLEHEMRKQQEMMDTLGEIRSKKTRIPAWG